MKIVDDIQEALAANPRAKSLVVPLSRADEFTDAVFSASTVKTFKPDIYPLQVETFMGLNFIGCSQNKSGSVEVF